MKNKLSMVAVSLFIGLSAPSSQASYFPGVCENLNVHDDDAFIIQAPAAVGGCAGNIAGGAVGGTLGLVVGKPAEGAYFVGLIGNAAGNLVAGTPTKLAKKVLWDKPKKWLGLDK